MLIRNRCGSNWRAWAILGSMAEQYRSVDSPSHATKQSGDTTVAKPEPDPELSIVVPTLNEAGTIEATLERIYEASTLPEGKCEVIVVDESEDATPDIVEGLDLRDLRLLRMEPGLGLARSVIKGFQASRSTFVGVIDADGQHPPEKLFEMYEAAVDGGYDIVVASRYVDGGAIPNWSAYRRLVSYGATWIAQWLLLRDVDIEDPMSGFFVVRRSHIDGVALNPIGYKILLDILVRTEPHVAEVGYVFSERTDGTSSLDYAEYLRYIRHVLLLIWYRIRNRL